MSTLGFHLFFHGFGGGGSKGGCKGEGKPSPWNGPDTSYPTGRRISLFLINFRVFQSFFRGLLPPRAVLDPRTRLKSIVRQFRSIWTQFQLQIFDGGPFCNIFYVLCTRYQVLRVRYQVPGTKYQVLGTKYQVSGARYQVLGTRYQVLGTRY